MPGIVAIFQANTMKFRSPFGGVDIPVCPANVTDRNRNVCPTKLGHYPILGVIDFSEVL
jgi:hypothetical protein